MDRHKKRLSKEEKLNFKQDALLKKIDIFNIQLGKQKQVTEAKQGFLSYSLTKLQEYVEYNKDYQVQTYMARSNNKLI